MARITYTDLDEWTKGAEAAGYTIEEDTEQGTVFYAAYDSYGRVRGIFDMWEPAPTPGWFDIGRVYRPMIVDSKERK